MKKILIKVVHVKKSFFKNLVLEDISFEVQEGEILGLLGFSGSGKTTLLNILCGYHKADSGDVLYYIKEKNEYKYVSIFDLSEDFKSQIGFSTQKISFYPELTVLENLKYFASLYSIKAPLVDEKIRSLLDDFDLTGFEHLLSKHLSEGMKKRLDIACAIVHNPKILILDEPTVNLDFRLQEEFFHYINKINKQGITIIFVSHMIEELTKHCAQIVMINKISKVIPAKGDIKTKFKEFVSNKKSDKVIKK